MRRIFPVCCASARGTHTSAKSIAHDRPIRTESILFFMYFLLSPSTRHSTLDTLNFT